MRPLRDTRRVDARVAQVAARQHGVISTRQLHLQGAGPDAIKRRVASGRLHRIHRGVYAVGHPSLSSEGRYMAAVVACGGATVLSHRSAAEHWGMLPRANGLPADRLGAWPPVHVTVPAAGGRRQRPGIILHRSRTIGALDCTRSLAIPVTTPARTLEDLRRTSPARVHRSALRQAEFLGLPLGEEVVSDHTRSELESRFLRLLRRHRLSQPEVNARVERFTVDFLWHRERVIVELDGWRTHRTRSAFEGDRSRDARLALLGYTVLRFTWRQLEADRATVIDTIRRVLARAPIFDR